MILVGLGVDDRARRVSVIWREAEEDEVDSDVLAVTAD